MDNSTTKLPSFKDFLRSRGKGGPKQGVDLLGALKKAKKMKLAKKNAKDGEKSAKKESKADLKEDKADKGVDEAEENT